MCKQFHIKFTYELNYSMLNQNKYYYLYRQMYFINYIFICILNAWKRTKICMLREYKKERKRRDAKKGKKGDDG